MQAALNILIVDDVAENRFLLTKTLLRKLPLSTCTECQELESALLTAQRDKPTIIIVHRAIDVDGPAVIRELRASGCRVPIIMVSGREACPEAIAAGATAFLNYDAWLRIGTVVEEVLGSNFVKAFTASPFQPVADPLGWRTAR